MAMVRPYQDGDPIEANLDLQELLKSKRYRFVVRGDSHESMVRTIGHLTLINAATLDRHDRQVCSVVDFDEADPIFSISRIMQLSRPKYFS